jgi:hypothetical protein
MKLTIILPWILATGALCGVAWFYGEAQKKNAEIASLHASVEDLQKVRAELEELKANQGGSSNNDLVQREHDELIRLRKQITESRMQNQQLLDQAKSAQAQAQNAQDQLQQAQARQGQPAVAPNVPNSEQAMALGCISNLRLIDGAKQQWAVGNAKPNGSLMTPQDLAKYLPNNAVPSCPAGGTYTINPVGIPPLCTVPGHSLSK